MMYSIRRADLDDHDFMMVIDLVNEGISEENPFLTSSPQEWKERRKWIATFADQSLNSGETELDTCPKCALIIHDDETKRRLGLLMFLFRDMNDPTFQYFGIYDKFERSVFPDDGRVCEIFQIWVASGERRKGLGKDLMKSMEEITRANDIKMIYTHTEATNDHVVKLCEKLGYEVIRKGTLWDQEVRISQIKDLTRT